MGEEAERANEAAELWEGPKCDDCGAPTSEPGTCEDCEAGLFDGH